MCLELFYILLNIEENDSISTTFFLTILELNGNMIIQEFQVTRKHYQQKLINSFLSIFWHVC